MRTSRQFITKAKKLKWNDSDLQSSFHSKKKKNCHVHVYVRTKSEIEIFLNLFLDLNELQNNKN